MVLDVAQKVAAGYDDEDHQHWHYATFKQAFTTDAVVLHKDMRKLPRLTATF